MSPGLDSLGTACNAKENRSESQEPQATEPVEIRRGLEPQTNSYKIPRQRSGNVPNHSTHTGARVQIINKDLDRIITPVALYTNRSASNSKHLLVSMFASGKLPALTYTNDL